MNPNKLDDTGYYVIDGMGNRKDFYEFLGVEKDAPAELIERKLSSKLSTFNFAHERGYFNLEEIRQGKEVLEKIDTCLLFSENRAIYDRRIEKKEKLRLCKKNPFINKKTVGLGIALIMLVSVAVSGNRLVNSGVGTYKDTHNVVVMYVVPSGENIGTNYLNKFFEDWGCSNYAVTKPERKDNTMYAGDVVIGRVTMEDAINFRDAGDGTIISPDYAVEELAGTHSLRGEFKKYANGESKISFDMTEIGLNSVNEEEINVCVKYVVKDKTNKDSIKFILKDWGFFDTSDKYKNDEFLYEGCTIIGRTTNDIADYIEDNDLGEVISVAEAVKELNKTNSLTGKFKEYALGHENFVFWNNSTKTMN